MENSFLINGGKELYGTVKIQTSKNATLPILTACCLHNGVIKLKNLPKLIDVTNMLKLLEHLGAQITNNKNYIIINTKSLTNTTLNEDLCKSMRSSIFLLGPLLSRFKQLSIIAPGGCKIGKRPIDLHIKAMQKMGVKVACVGEKIFFNAQNAHSAKIKLKIPSVGVTENIIQFACLLPGKTKILNPAKEPEVVDLCSFLNKLGANIIGAGTNCITIYGVERLNNTTYQPIPDRIVEGTVMCAVALTGGKVKLTNCRNEHNLALIKILKSVGCSIEIGKNNLTIERKTAINKMKNITTNYYPGLPTDLQSFVLLLSCFAKNKTKIKEKIFENRFLIVPELQKMGAKIKQKNNHVVVTGSVNNLTANTLQVQDLRGGASLILAALTAKGTSKVNNICLVDRGYEQFENVLNLLGADVKRV